MRDILEAVVDGSLLPAEAEIRLSGYATTDAGRSDATREMRHGVPKAILAEGRTPDETVTLVVAAVETSGRAFVIRADTAHAEAVADALPDADIDRDARAKVVVAAAPEFERPDLDATVAIATGGTSDAEAASEAAAVLREMDVDVERIEDVGVAHLGRVLDSLDTLREADVVAVAAGREGALSAVAASLVDTPVIDLSVPTGYGYGSDGETVVLGMFQSCTVLSAMNVDAGYIISAQAGLIVCTVADAHNDDAWPGAVCPPSLPTSVPSWSCTISRAYAHVRSPYMGGGLCIIHRLGGCRATAMPVCDHCGSHVSKCFARVFADENGQIPACPNCSANAGIAEVARQRARTV